MKHIIYLLIGISLIGCFACTTVDGILNPPVDGKKGSLFISTTDSGLKGARIFVDCRDSGQRTPALIEDLSIDSHQIHLFLEGYAVVSGSAVVKADRQDTVRLALTKAAGSGQLKFTRQPEGTLVMVDGLPFGRTPLTIDRLAAGQHQIRLIKGGYSRVDTTVQLENLQVKVLNNSLKMAAPFKLVEDFSHVNCPNCVAVNKEVGRIITEKRPNVVFIGFHTDVLGKDDPMFKAAPDENKARGSYYKIVGVPRVILNGTVNYFLGTIKKLAGELDKPGNTTNIAKLDIYGILDVLQPSGQLNGKIRVDALQNFPASGLRLQIALIEREIKFAKAPGINGETVFHEIMRDMYPVDKKDPKKPQTGQLLQLSRGESRLVDFQFKLKPGWKEKELEVVTFLQDEQTRAVVQAFWSVSLKNN